MSVARSGIGLACFLALCLGAGAVGAIATAPQVDAWYRTLVRPSWSPPDWLFGPVWTTLYVLMAIAAWRIWLPAGARGARTPLILFGVQLLLNAAWSWVFFGLQRPGWALLEIVLLWLAIAATTAAFFRRSAWAGALMVLYLAWVSFAAVLNGALVWLNAR